MPKLKTKRSAAKRFSVTKTGKIKTKKSHLRHNLTKKSRKRKDNLRKCSFVAQGDLKKVKKQIPYS